MSRKREYALKSSEIVEHSELEGLENDDHPQYMATDIAREISVQHEFNPFQVAPFKVGDDAADYLVDGLNADLLDGLEASDLATAIHTHVKSDVSDLESISATPTADTIPLADGSGIIAAGWLPSGVNTDFDISAPADHDALYYDNSSGKWKNTASVKINDGGQVAITGANNIWFSCTATGNSTGMLYNLPGQQWLCYGTTGAFYFKNQTSGLNVIRCSIAGQIDLKNDVVMAASGGKVGFYGTAPIVKATVTGSRAGNAALASLLTALAAHGLIIDSSS